MLLILNGYLKKMMQMSFSLSHFFIPIFQIIRKINQHAQFFDMHIIKVVYTVKQNNIDNTYPHVY